MLDTHPTLIRRGNKLAAYWMNLHKRYDLDNYLQYKPITSMDFVRAAYYHFMTKTGLADTYRNEQFLSKSDFAYELEKQMIAVNWGGPDKKQVASSLKMILNK